MRSTECHSGFRSLQHCVSAGSGEQMVSEYKTSVLYHNNSPRWNETVRVSVNSVSLVLRREEGSEFAGVGYWGG